MPMLFPMLLKVSICSSKSLKYNTSYTISLYLLTFYVSTSFSIVTFSESFFKILNAQGQKSTNYLKAKLLFVKMKHGDKRMNISHAVQTQWDGAKQDPV